MTDLDRIEYALQAVLAKCRQRNIGDVPPDGQTIMEWFAAAIDEAKGLRIGPRGEEAAP